MANQTFSTIIAVRKAKLVRSIFIFLTNKLIQL